MSQAEATKGTAGRRPPVRQRGAGRAALISAAHAEFSRAGFDGTDTNRIARRAGYAPQTFYRHFADKTAIFVAVYDRWLEDEMHDADRAAARGPEAAARVILQHHSKHREFRRSLRRLTVADPVVRRARAASRRRQVELLGEQAFGSIDGRARVALILCIERIADAAADGELKDLGFSAKAQTDLLAYVIRKLGRP